MPDVLVTSGISGREWNPALFKSTANALMEGAFLVFVTLGGGLVLRLYSLTFLGFRLPRARQAGRHDYP
jgi:hypothetical protein